MATLRRVEKAGKLPTLDKLLWRWFPNASSIRQKLQASGTNVTLGDFAFTSLALSVAVAFLLFVIVDLAPPVALGSSLMIGVGLPNVWIGWKAKRRGQKFNLLFPEAVDLIVRALRAGLSGPGGDRHGFARHQGSGRRCLSPRAAGSAARRADRHGALAGRQDGADRRVQLSHRRHVDSARHRRQSRGDAGQSRRLAARPPAASPEDPRLHFGGAHHDVDHGWPAVSRRRRSVWCRRTISARCSRRRPAR